MKDLIARREIRWSDEWGASLVEYTLLVTLIAIAALLAITFFGATLAGEYSDISSAVASATG